MPVTRGWGYVIWDDEDIITERNTHSGSFNSRVSTSHIYVKEMLAATFCVESICKEKANCRILLCVDNTAAVGSIRAMYSSNVHANGLIVRLYDALNASGNVLEIVSVRSSDNAADPASRALPNNNFVTKKCLDVIQLHEEGYGKSKETNQNAPAFSGNLRHEDSVVDEIDLLLDIELPQEGEADDEESEC